MKYEVINPAYRVYQYVYGTRNRYSYTNSSEYIYVPGPCYDPNDDSIELKKNSTRHPLCNSTTTRVVNYYVHNENNQDIPGNSGRPVHLISNERFMFTLVFLLYVSIVYLKSIIVL